MLISIVNSSEKMFPYSSLTKFGWNFAGATELVITEMEGWPHPTARFSIDHLPVPNTFRPGFLEELGPDTLCCAVQGHPEICHVRLTRDASSGWSASPPHLYTSLCESIMGVSAASELRTLFASTSDNRVHALTVAGNGSQLVELAHGRVEKAGALLWLPHPGYLLVAGEKDGGTTFLGIPYSAGEHTFAPPVQLCASEMLASTMCATQPDVVAVWDANRAALYEMRLQQC